MASNLNELSKPQAIELAHRMKAKAKNIKLSASKMTNRALGLGVAGGAGYLAGYMMGGLRHEKESMSEAQIEADGDPTQWFGVNKDIVVGTVGAVVSISGMLGEPERNTAALVVDGAATGILAGALYGAGNEKGYEGAAEEATAP